MEKERRKRGQVFPHTLKTRGAGRLTYRVWTQCHGRQCQYSLGSGFKHPRNIPVRYPVRFQFRTTLPQLERIVARSECLDRRKEIHSQLRISLDVPRVVIVRSGVLNAKNHVRNTWANKSPAERRPLSPSGPIMSLGARDELTKSVILGFQLS